MEVFLKCILDGMIYLISQNLSLKLLVTPVIDMFRCLFKKRDKGLHWLIAIQIFLFITYWFVVYETAEMRYLYMLKTFDGFSGADYLFILQCLLLYSNSFWTSIYSTTDDDKFIWPVE